ncbi:MAG: cryptochrome/photolyase family protein [Alphaproteobacteria bacterium]|nr:cryptochrome/photolyase family protein [Alphaproteobacteria bacterium]
MTATLAAALKRENPDPAGRSWLFVPYDQLTDALGPLGREDPHTLGILLVECPAKAVRRPYHKQKLALVLTNLRHFALEQVRRGVAVRWVVAGGYADAVRDLAREVGPIRMMEAAERELRVELAPLVREGLLQVVPHEGWLTTDADFAAIPRPWRMDAFYRQVRRRTGVLMEGGKPVGGRFSFDGENREPWRGDPPAPALPRYAADDVTAEVVDLVTTRFADHPGTLDPEALPATRDDAETAWAWALRECLPTFGPYEDAMSTRSSNLFHTRVSALLNLHRLLPARVVRDVAALDAPLPSREGFVRQVLGWREFVRHVHRATDGFRTVPSNVLGQDTPLPPVFWGGAPSGMACLDGVVDDVWREAHSHHITRLMVLANVAQLLDVDPRALTDWFWVAYTDAYDWVVEPNVLGMGTFSVGDAMTTKPYVAGSGYVQRMSDYCTGCRFHPKKSCPLTPMYWAYLARHRGVLDGVDRAKRQVLGLDRRAPERQASDARIFEAVRDALAEGERLDPAKLPTG